MGECRSDLGTNCEGIFWEEIKGIILESLDERLWYSQVSKPIPEFPKNLEPIWGFFCFIFLPILIFPWMSNPHLPVPNPGLAVDGIPEF